MIDLKVEVVETAIYDVMKRQLFNYDTHCLVLSQTKMSHEISLHLLRFDYISSDMKSDSALSELK